MIEILFSVLFFSGRNCTPISIDNSDVQNLIIPALTDVTVTCVDGFRTQEFEKSYALRCTESGQWSGEKRCIGKVAFT